MSLDNKAPNGNGIDKYMVDCKTLGRESLIEHAAIQSGIAAGSKESATYQMLSSVVTAMGSYIKHANTTQARSNDSAVTDQRWYNLSSTGFVVGTVSTLIAQLLAQVGLNVTVESCAAYFTSACANGPHAHILNMTCRTFANACLSGSAGAASSVLSFLMQTLVQYLRKEGITLGDNVVTGLLIGVSTAICTFLLEGVVAVFVGGLMAQAITDLRLRAQKSRKSIITCMGDSISYAVQYYSRFLISLFSSPFRTGSMTTMGLSVI